MKVLIAEDDKNLLKSLIHVFRKNKFLVDGVGNGIDALDYALTDRYDVIILDIMMPGMMGIDVLKQIREKNISTPVIFLTAKSETSQKIEGLDAGADDYLAKPFFIAELLARTRAVLRRKENYVPELLEFNELILNRATYQLEYGEFIVPLSSKEYQLMEMMMERPGIITSIDDIIANVWGWDSDIDNSTVWVHISNLRKKFRKVNAPVSISFVRGAGYIISACQESEEQ